jgi:uncharacterized membrane protein
MLKRALLMAMLAAGPAAASPEYILPTLFDVEGVASGDVLNIRETPSASGGIIGTLAPDATGIEVMALDPSGKWGQVNAGEQSGWVAMRFLNYRTDVWESRQLPEGLSCGGTEPFWSYRAEGGSLIWTEPGSEIAMSGLTVMDGGFGRDPRRGLFVEDDHGIFTATITPAQCSDGMSDMAYGLETTVIMQSRDAAPVLFSGCCRIAR